MTRLFIVEGPPCSGKSSTAKYIAGWLTKNRAAREVVCLDEGTGKHPADYEDCAYVTGEQLAGFPPGLREMVRACAAYRLDGYIVPLSRLGGAALQRVLPYKIYDALPWEAEMPVMLDKWRSFAEGAEEHACYVFNCVFLQNPMCETMMRFGFSLEQSLEYVGRIAEIIAPMEPAVVYLKENDIAGRVRAVSEERPGWLEGVIKYHEESAYGRSIGAKGFEGYAACLEERQRRELDILGRLPVRSLVVEEPGADWKGAYAQIEGFLKAGLPRPRSVFGG